jgi:hypothetical protein
MPKPRPENIQRAERLCLLLDAQYKTTLPIQVGSVTDVLADLMHLCSQNKISFGYALRQARYYYNIETKNPSKETSL